ncbi:MAG: DUF3050 domain-containing protein [Cyclobacteriaceae bacterium]|nr:DUF3050 domain-containing protein [Cyclobacteriaceae bacterium]MCH8514920.1 DUF3050 domain-containing protein [Cyclobacteriaceae bacterium]
MSSLTTKDKARIEQLIDNIRPLQTRLYQHELYAALNSIDDLKFFTERHVYAVWDFMSLLKSLQIGLTSVSLPWVPKGSGETRYLINEIVTGEESDELPDGRRLSHFEMYLESMRALGASTSSIEDFSAGLSAGFAVQQALHKAKAPEEAARFVKDTFRMIEQKSLHEQAAAFTFGREDLIPGMFIEFVKALGENHEEVKPLQFYFERHIEVDGGHHSELAYKMTAELCGDDDLKWQQAEEAAKLALESRLKLWDAIKNELNYNHSAALS